MIMAQQCRTIGRRHHESPRTNCFLGRGRLGACGRARARELREADLAGAGEALRALVRECGLDDAGGIPPAEWRRLMQRMRALSASSPRCNQALACLICAYGTRGREWRVERLGGVNGAVVLAAAWRACTLDASFAPLATADADRTPSGWDPEGASLLADVLGDRDDRDEADPDAADAIVARVALLALGVSASRHPQASPSPAPPPQPPDRESVQDGEPPPQDLLPAQPDPSSMTCESPLVAIAAPLPDDGQRSDSPKGQQRFRPAHDGVAAGDPSTALLPETCTVDDDGSQTLDDGRPPVDGLAIGATDVGDAIPTFRRRDRPQVVRCRVVRSPSGHNQPCPDAWEGITDAGPNRPDSPDESAEGSGTSAAAAEPERDVEHRGQCRDDSSSDGADSNSRPPRTEPTPLVSVLLTDRYVGDVSPSASTGGTPTVGSIARASFATHLTSDAAQATRSALQLDGCGDDGQAAASPRAEEMEMYPAEPGFVIVHDQGVPPSRDSPLSLPDGASGASAWWQLW